MDKARKAFAKIMEVDYGSLPYSGEHEAEHDWGHKRKWGRLGVAFIKEVAGNCGGKAVGVKHNPSGSIDRGYVSGFVSNAEGTRFVYINVSDCTLYKGGFGMGEVLYRTAGHERDYAGGANRTCTLARPESVDGMEDFIRRHLNG